jgi:membrane protein DedA with SNARE-associated domain
LAVVEILKPLIEIITGFIGSLGYPGIFILMILESALIPIPSEIIMPFSGFLATTGKLEPLGVVIAGTLGNLVGSIATYYLGLKLGRAFIIRYGKYIFFRQRHLELTESLFQKYGEKISFIGRLLPGIRTYVSLPAGIGRTKLGNFVIYSVAGAALWNSALTYIGMQLGRNWKNIDRYSIYLDMTALVIVAILVIWFIHATRRDKYTKSQL